MNKKLWNFGILLAFVIAFPSAMAVQPENYKERIVKDLNSNNKPAKGGLNAEDLKVKPASKLNSKESANPGMNTNKPARGKLNSNDLKIKKPPKLNSKERA